MINLFFFLTEVFGTNFSHTSIASDFPRRRVHKSKCSFLTSGSIFAANQLAKEKKRESTNIDKAFLA